MKNILVLFTILMSSISIAQKKDYFLMTFVEAGQINSNYKNPSSLITVSDSYNNYYGKLNVSVLFELNNKIQLQFGLGQQIRYWNLKGQTTTGKFTIKQKQYIPSINAGAKYQTPIKQRKILGFIGYGLSLDLIDFEPFNKTEGNDTDFITAEIEKSNAIIVNLEHEIGVKGYFRNQNQWLVSFKYYHPINSSATTSGSANHNNGANRVKFSASGKMIALSLKYAFKLNR